MDILKHMTKNKTKKKNWSITSTCTIKRQTDKIAVVYLAHLSL